MSSPLLSAYKQGTKEYKIASDNYEYGYKLGKADGIRDLRDLLLGMFDTYRSNGFNFDAESFLLNQLKEQTE